MSTWSEWYSGTTTGELVLHRLTTELYVEELWLLDCCQEGEFVFCLPTCLSTCQSTYNMSAIYLPYKKSWIESLRNANYKDNYFRFVELGRSKSFTFQLSLPPFNQHLLVTDLSTCTLWTQINEICFPFNRTTGHIRRHHELLSYLICMGRFSPQEAIDQFHEYAN